MRYTVAFLALCLVGTASAQAPAVAEVQVFPPEINLFTSRAKQTFVVQALQADGITRDVTAQARVTATVPNVVRVEKNVVHPAADGATELVVEHGGKSVKIGRA